MFFAAAVVTLLLAQMPPAPPECGLEAAENWRYADAAGCAKAWRPVADSLSPTPQDLGGHAALYFPCNFAASPEERSYWDHTISFNLALHRGVRFSMYCADPAPVSYFALYFRSGKGWYTFTFAPDQAGVWSEIVIDKTKANVEGTPSGWGAIDLMRVSAWRGTAVDTGFYLIDFGVVKGNPEIALIAADWAATQSSADARISEETFARVAGWLDTLGLSFAPISDLDLTAERLSYAAVAILPYNPKLPEAALAALKTYLDSGGKVIACYSTPVELLERMGMKPGPWARSERDGMFSSVRPEGAGLPGMPAETLQNSWNIQTASPASDSARVAGRWYDASGTAQQSAIVVSDKGLHFAHVLLPGDGARKERLLLSMLTPFIPDAPKRAAAYRLDHAGAFGPYDGYAAAVAGISAAAERPEAAALASRAKAAYDAAAVALAKGDCFAALDASDTVRGALLDAYCAIQTPQAGEWRAFWCHDGYGIPGMSWDQAVSILAANGFNAILPNMCWGGMAHYPSKVLPVSPRVAAEGDQIALCLAACRKYGVACHVWKVNWKLGNRSDKAFQEKMRTEGRLQKTFSGKANAEWLCPSNPANQQLEIAAMLEIARNYDVDGIHYDYIRYPDGDGCFCDGCRKRFETAIGKKVANWPMDVRADKALEMQWFDFRRAQITAVVAGVSKVLRGEKPKVKISAAVFRNWPRDRDTVGQDWKAWCERGYLDFVCPMDYTEHTSAFEGYIKQQQGWCAGVPCYPGIGLSCWRDATDVPKLIEQILVTRRLGTGGFTVFNYAADEAREVLPRCGLGITRVEAEAHKE